MNVRYESLAEDDLRALIEEKASRGHPDPEGFTKLLRLRIAALAMFPHSGRCLPDSSAREWRLHGTTYIVLYQQSASGVDVLRVIDTKERG